MDFEPLDDTPFSASFDFPLGQLTIADSKFSAGRIVRSREAIIKGGDDAFSFMIARTSELHCEQMEYQLRAKRGEAVLTRNDEPISTGSSGGFGGINLIMPKAEFAARGIRPDDAVMRRLPKQNEALSLLRSYLRTLVKSGINNGAEFGTTSAVREVAQRHIFDLVALAVSWRDAVGESNLESVVDARLRVALDYIDTHFDDPQLTIEVVASAQGVSATYLRRLLKDSGRSFREVVNELRLRKAFTALSTADHRSTVLEVAMEAGFSDISYFNRLFRTRFGGTPSGVRKKALSQ
jgi:AraC-like DNA-binding protein